MNFKLLKLGQTQRKFERKTTRGKTRATWRLYFSKVRVKYELRPLQIFLFCTRLDIRSLGLRWPEKASTQNISTRKNNGGSFFFPFKFSLWKQLDFNGLTKLQTVPPCHHNDRIR